MCSDLVYVILFPQLLMVVHFKKYCNTYGSLAAYIVACFFRVAGGEDVIGLPVIIKYPWFDGQQRFPFRTMAMLLSLGTLVFVTWLSKCVLTAALSHRGWYALLIMFSFLCRWLFETGRLSPEYDYFNCVVNIPEDIVTVHNDSPEEGHLAALASVTSVPTYGGMANTLVGVDERNGRVNPALDLNDDDIDLTEMKRRKARRQSQQQSQSIGNRSKPFQDQTTF